MLLFDVIGQSLKRTDHFDPATDSVEVGDKTTDFEPYNGAEYIPASDGTVSGMTSLSPNMTILTDTAGAIVECEYIRDTNKVIEKLTNAIIALGGSV